MTAKRFNQERKIAVEGCKEQVKYCIKEHYNVEDNEVVSVEYEHGGEYNTEGDYQPTDLLDYAGIDWLVDDKPMILGVGERIRPNTKGRRDFSWRVDNGTSKPCESDRIPAGLDGGIVPATLLFGWRTKTDLERAWLIDIEKLCGCVESGVFDGEEKPTGDGTIALYIPIGDLVANDCVLNAWQFGDNV